MLDIEREAFIESEVERELAPYRAILPPEAIETMRGMLTDMLATHPVASRLVDRLTRAPIVASSGPVDEDADPEDEKNVAAPDTSIESAKRTPRKQKGGR